MRHLRWKSFLKPGCRWLAWGPLGTRSERPDGRPGDKLFFKFFTTCVGVMNFTVDLSHGNYMGFFALHKRFRRATIC